jgi:hypothetical protein
MFELSHTTDGDKFGLCPTCRRILPKNPVFLVSIGEDSDGSFEVYMYPNGSTERWWVQVSYNEKPRMSKYHYLDSLTKTGGFDE